MRGIQNLIIISYCICISFGNCGIILTRFDSIRPVHKIIEVEVKVVSIPPENELTVTIAIGSACFILLAIFLLSCRSTSCLYHNRIWSCDQPDDSQSCGSLTEQEFLSVDNDETSQTYIAPRRVTFSETVDHTNEPTLSENVFVAVEGDHVAEILYGVLNELRNVEDERSWRKPKAYLPRRNLKSKREQDGNESDNRIEGSSEHTRTF